MVQIDEELLRKRAEHNDRSLRNLEEISLHQQNIEGINRFDDPTRTAPTQPRVKSGTRDAPVCLGPRMGDRGQGERARARAAHANPRDGRCVLWFASHAAQSHPMPLPRPAQRVGPAPSV